jgi:hypothetical protein
MEALKKSLDMRKPPKVAQAASGSAEAAEKSAKEEVSAAEAEQPRRKPSRAELKQLRLSECTSKS